MTYFNHENVLQRTRVFDVDTKEEIKQVVHIETDTGYLELHELPIKVSGNQFINTTSRRRYRSIHAIYGGECLPCMFHCYGRIV